MAKQGKNTNAKLNKEAPETDAKPKSTGGVVIRPDLDKYVNGVSGSGKRTKRADHPVSAALDGLTIDEVYRIASKMTETSQKDLHDKYDHLNVGMQRMNLGNRIRGAVAAQDKAYEKDNKVATGMKLLELECEGPHAARAKRIEAAAKAKAEREAAAAAKAKEKADADAKAAAAAKADAKKRDKPAVAA